MVTWAGSYKGPSRPVSWRLYTKSVAGRTVENQLGQSVHSQGNERESNQPPELIIAAVSHYGTSRHQDDGNGEH